MSVKAIPGNINSSDGVSSATVAGDHAQNIRLLDAMRDIDRAIIRLDDRRDMFERICQILVQEAGYRMAWIGMADLQSGRVHPVASAGQVEDYLQSAVIRCDDTPEGRGVTGMVIRTGQPQVNDDTETNETFAPWRDQARKLEYRSSAGFPLFVGEEVIGAINIYAHQPHAFPDDNLRLLEEMARTIGIALLNQQNLERRLLAEQSLRNVQNELESSTALTADLAREITEQARQQRIIKSAANRTRVLSELMRAGLEAKTVDALLKRALTILTDSTNLFGHASAAAAFLVDQQPEQQPILRMVTASANFPPTDRARCAEVPFGTCLCGRAAEQGCVIYADSNDPRHDRDHAYDDPHGHICIPLKNEERTLGLILIHADARFHWPDGDTIYLGHLGDAVSLGLNNILSHDELGKARNEAERANAAKSEFLARMSHELRTPMNAILGFGQLLQMEAADFDEQQRESLDHIMDGGRHLLHLIDEVLDIAAVDAGSMKLNVEPVLFQHTMDSALMLVKPMAEEARVTITVEPCEETLRILVDERRFKQVLINLLSNAVKYNQPGGTVDIVCGRIPQEAGTANDLKVRIAIRDSGRGIPKEFQQRIFDPFERVKPHDVEIQGAGIGLSITKKLVELMGGVIDLESEPGRGSCFWMDFPSVEGDDAAENLAPGDEEPANLVLPAHMRILYVEDDPANLLLVQELFRRNTNCTVFGARSGEEGVQLAQDLRPDVILMDIDLPGMDGFEALDQLKAEPRTRDIPVIAVSAHALPDHVKKGRAATFVEYLTKPINTYALMRIVASAAPKR